MKTNYKKNKQNYYGGTLSTTMSGFYTLSYLNSLIYDTQNDMELVAESPDLLDDLEELRTKYRNKTLNILNKNKNHIELYEKKIKEYFNLIYESSSENDYQKFFETNYSFFNPHVINCVTKPDFGGDCQPDFLLTLKNGGSIIIEIETPNIKLFRNSDNVQSSEFSKSIDQINRYMAWIRKNASFLRDNGIDIDVDNAEGLLIIGMKSTLNNNEITKLQSMNYTYRGIFKIKTFDEIYDENITNLTHIKEMS